MNTHLEVKQTPPAHVPRGGRATARHIGVALTAAAVLALVGCGAGSPGGSGDKQATSVPCGLVVDGSGSGASNGAGMDVEAKLKDTLVPFLTDRHCNLLAYAPVTLSSLTSSCRVSAVDLDPKPQSDTDDVDVLRQRARTQALAGSLTMLACARTQGGSDVLGALARIADAMPKGEGTPSILAVSDFEQADAQFQIFHEALATPADRERAVDKLLAGRGVPALNGMNLYPVGYGMNRAGRPTDYAAFDAFWNEILTRRAKAHVDHIYG